jgi:hypothetical protein
MELNRTARDCPYLLEIDENKSILHENNAKFMT